MGTDSENIDFISRFFFSYKLQIKESPLLIRKNGLDHALAVGLEKSLLSCASDEDFKKSFLEVSLYGSKIPESLQNVSRVLQFTRNIAGLKCTPLDDMLAFARVSGLICGCSPDYSVKKVLVSPRYASERAKELEIDEHFHGFVKRVYGELDLIRKKGRYPHPKIL